MSNLPLESIPSVALDFMNEDHHEATLQMNALHAALANYTPEQHQAICEQLEAVFQHSSEHFAREEAEMVRTGFPAYSCHKGEHERVLNELSSVLESWKSEMPAAQLADYLNNTLSPWFINHLQTMDTVTAMYVSQQS